MKKILLVLIPLLGINLSFCQQPDTTGTTQNLLHQIASDSIFAEFVKSATIMAAFIAEDAIDVFAAAEVVASLDSSYQNRSSCELPENLFSNIRGGKWFLELMCQTDKIKIALKDKYGAEFQQLTKEQYGMILDLFLKNGGDKIRSEAWRKASERIGNPAGGTKKG